MKNNCIDRLSEKEKKFLKLQLSKQKVYLALCWVNILIAVLMLVYMLYNQVYESLRMILILMLLLNARSNLKHFKNIKLLRHLYEGLTKEN